MMAGLKNHTNSPNYYLLLFIVASSLAISAASAARSPEDRPPLAVKSAYYPSWITTLPPSSINTSLFTHIFYAFLAPNNATFKFEVSNSTAASLVGFTSALRYARPPAKALFSVGGEGSGAFFALMAAKPSSRRAFISSCIEVARKFGFDGVDLDWEFPQSPNEASLLGLVMKEFRSAIKKEAQITSRPPLLLTAAVYFSADFFLAAAPYSYPAASMSRSLDWVNVMSYDYNGAWSNTTGPNSALFDPSSDVNTIFGLKSWIRAGMPKEKIVMGLSVYGRTWQLNDPVADNRFGATAIGPGRGNGVLTFAEVDGLVNESGATVVYDVDTVSLYTVVGSSWISFDNAFTINTKIGFAQALGIRGYFFGP